MSAFKGLNPNFVAARCFHPFQINLVIWLLSQDWAEGSLPLCLEWSFSQSTSTTLWHFWKKWWYRKSREQSPEE